MFQQIGEKINSRSNKLSFGEAMLVLGSFN